VNSTYQRTFRRANLRLIDASFNR